MKIPVVWLTFNETPARCRWDQGVIDIIAPHHLYLHHSDQSEVFPTDGAVVAFAAGHNEEYVPQLNHFIANLEWCVLLLTSDEESTFPWHRIHHPNMRIWVQYPRPDKHSNPSLRYLPLGAPLSELDSLSLIPSDREPIYDWFFSGQVTHAQRDNMIESMSRLPGGLGLPSLGFTQGMPRREYLHSLASSKICPSPTGPASADSFRTWEALEAGAVPIVDDGPRPDDLGRAISGYPTGFWELLLGEVPFPVVHDWEHGPAAARAILDGYPVANNIVFAWWQLKKRELRQRLSKDVEELSGRVVQGDGVNDIITVLVSTSPVPSNPDYSHLQETLKSVCDQLPTSEILLMLDGVRDEQSHLRASYEEYQRRVLRLANHTWDNVTPIRFNDHTHQAEMTRRTLELVDTPLVLFVEHDTPLTGHIPWDLCASQLMTDHLDLVRFYHETVMQPEHEPLMLDSDGVFIKTIQFSQRPHLALTDYYRRVINDHFEIGERHFIEDRLHGVVQDEGWESHRLAIYAEGDNIQRSTHSDARAGAEKWVS